MLILCDVQKIYLRPTCISKHYSELQNPVSLLQNHIKYLTATKNFVYLKTLILNGMKCPHNSNFLTRSSIYKIMVMYFKKSKCLQSIQYVSYNKKCIQLRSLPFSVLNI